MQRWNPRRSAVRFRLSQNLVSGFFGTTKATSFGSQTHVFRDAEPDKKPGIILFQVVQRVAQTTFDRPDTLQIVSDREQFAVSQSEH